jgi:hypothetical protein
LRMSLKRFLFDNNRRHLAGMSGVKKLSTTIFSHIIF